MKPKTRKLEANALTAVKPRTIRALGMRIAAFNLRISKSGRIYLLHFRFRASVKKEEREKLSLALYNTEI